MHRLLRNQLTRCRAADGSLDVDRLLDLVAATYDEVDRERKRTDRSTRLMIEELEAASHERSTAAQALERLAFCDPLTGLANRALFTSHLDSITTAPSADARSLLLLDLDRFKDVNDSLGHAAGDELLVQVAERLSRITPSGSVVARLGGDEFACILPPNVSPDASAQIASVIVAELMQPIRLTDAFANIGTSIGIAVFPQDGRTGSDLMRHADLALYEAKRCGRSTFIRYHEKLGETAQGRVVLTQDLRKAIAGGSEFELHFQPQIDMASGTTHGFEALIRWHHPSRGLVGPAEFIPVAETANLICPIGHWVLREAARQAKEWLDLGLPEREVAVNISALQLMQPSFVNEVADVLHVTGLPPNLLCIELTESALADHENEAVERVLRNLKRLGVQLALDDFGTYYSSLGYLIRLPFDKLKVDKIFVRYVANSARAERLLSGIISLGHGLGMEVVAEGAETTTELDIVRSLGGNLVQGYAVAAPARAEDAVRTANLIDARAKLLSAWYPASRRDLRTVRSA